MVQFPLHFFALLLCYIQCSKLHKLIDLDKLNLRVQCLQPDIQSHLMQL